MTPAPREQNQAKKADESSAKGSTTQTTSTTNQPQVTCELIVLKVSNPTAEGVYGVSATIQCKVGNRFATSSEVEGGIFWAEPPALGSPGTIDETTGRMTMTAGPLYYPKENGVSAWVVYRAPPKNGEWKPLGEKKRIPLPADKVTAPPAPVDCVLNALVIDSHLDGAYDVYPLVRCTVGNAPANPYYLEGITIRLMWGAEPITAPFSTISYGGLIINARGLRFPEGASQVIATVEYKLSLNGQWKPVPAGIESNPRTIPGNFYLKRFSAGGRFVAGILEGNSQLKYKGNYPLYILNAGGSGGSYRVWAYTSGQQDVSLSDLIEWDTQQLHLYPGMDDSVAQKLNGLTISEEDQYDYAIGGQTVLIKRVTVQ